MGSYVSKNEGIIIYSNSYNLQDERGHEAEDKTREHFHPTQLAQSFVETPNTDNISSNPNFILKLIQNYIIKM